MEKEYIIRLTFKVHKLIERCKDYEFLQLKIESLANEVLANFILLSSFKENSLVPKILENILEIKNSWAFLRAKKVIKREEFLFLVKEYENIEKEIAKRISYPKRVIKSSFQEETRDIKMRQMKILEILKEKQNIQVKDLKEIFSKVSKRTLRRDLDELVKKGLAKRIGMWNTISYKTIDSALVGQGRT